MAIRTWYYTHLIHRQGAYREDGDFFYSPAVQSAPLKALPNDFHVFIVTTHQLPAFLLWVDKENLNIHYQDKEPSYNYRYPQEPRKLYLFVLTVKKELK